MKTTVTTFGCAEWLRARGFSREGELEFVPAQEMLPNRIYLRDIQAEVARRFGLSSSDMTSARRSRYVARPRQIAMYLSKQLTPLSLPEIGRRFNRDHTTVIHACRQIEKLRQIDPEIDASVRAVARSLEAR